MLDFKSLFVEFLGLLSLKRKSAVHPHFEFQGHNRLCRFDGVLAVIKLELPTME